MTRLVPPASASSEQVADATTVVTLDGDFDLANVAATRHRITDMLAITGHDVIVDLRGVTFADSTLLSTLIAALRRAEAHRHQLVLIRPNEHVWKAFSITGVDKVFTGFANLAQARCHLAAAREQAMTS